MDLPEPPGPRNQLLTSVWRCDRNVCPHQPPITPIVFPRKQSSRTRSYPLTSTRPPNPGCPGSLSKQGYNYISTSRSLDKQTLSTGGKFERPRERTRFPWRFERPAVYLFNDLLCARLDRPESELEICLLYRPAEDWIDP